ncbi:MAG: membrane protein insertase YidC [Ruminococcaceae bacterium]|nr:membrane protein insertase YidC [Oscillospiraceae bacterium]
MDIIGEILGTPLGYVLKLCYDIFKDYGLAIIIFTLLTKVILFPVSLLVQKNSVKMIKMKPQLDQLKYQYVDDKDALLDAQSELYKKEKYSPFAGMSPLFIQLPLIFGLIDVVYRPLKHILHIPAEVINAFVEKAKELSGLADLGSAPELKVMQLVSDGKNYDAFMSLEQGALSGYDVGGFIEKMQSINMSFLGIDLSSVPTLALNLLFLIPLFAGISALLMCIVQNKINVLQIEQGFFGRWGMTIFMIAFSTYFAFLVPGGVGLYWIFGNLFSIPVMYLVNMIYNPNKYIDYKTLNNLKEKAKEEAKINRENKALSKKYYKEICRGDNLQNMDLVFYSEGSGFYKYFENIIESILKNSDITITYITNDPKDAIFKKNNPRIKPYYISGNQLITLMMKLECKIVVMTTPDLEKYHIKRSKMKKNIEYIYVDHGCTSLNLTYRTGALDYFDTVFVVSRSQGLEIRAMENLRNTHKKRIVKCGYGLMDNMLEAYSKKEKKENEKPVILIAPSWQYDNILDSCIDDIVNDLVCDKYKVIIRPHPQYIKRFPVRMEEMFERYKDKLSEDFIIQTDFSSTDTVYNSDIMITDWSGIAFEYSFTTNRPTLFVNTQMKVVNKDYKKISIEPFDITGRNKVGRSIEKSECCNISKTVEDFLVHKDDYAEQISNLRNEYFYNLGSSGEAGADYIIRRIKGLPLGNTNKDTNKDN